MNKIFGFLKNPKFGLFFVVVCLICTIAFIWLCLINYKTTYQVLSHRMPIEAAVAFTLVIQGFEFFIPIMTVLGIMQALEMSKIMKVILYTAWVIVMSVDFLTAFAYFVNFYVDPVWYDKTISVALSGIFLFAEIFVILSVVSLITSINFWKRGSIPNWLTQHTSMTTQLDDLNSKSNPKKYLRDLKTGGELWELENGTRDAFAKNDPAIARI